MEFDLEQLGIALSSFARLEVPAWIGEAHADLISLVGKGAIDRTAIDTGRLVNNWQGWVGPSTIASKVQEVKSFSPSPNAAQFNIEALANDVRDLGKSGVVVDKTVILNNTPYALIQEEGNARWSGRHMALGAIDAAESAWGDGSAP